MGKGSNTTSTSTYSAPDAQAGGLYRSILDRASGVASTPYQAYSGPLTADVNSQQNLGISGINQNAGYANPYISRAAELAGSSVAPIGGQDLIRYYDPYQQKVIDTTTAQLRNDFGQQHAQLQGNQISQGALGGNATGVAKGILAGQQARTLGSTVAGLESAGFDKAMAAAQRQQQTGLSGANAFANYGLQGQQAALAGAGQQIAAGTLQQTTEQARLNALYQQYAQAQAYPYQQTQWLAGIGTGVGSNLGGTGTGSTTGPAPNQTAQWVGAGLSAAALLSDREAKDHIEHIGKMHDGTPIFRFKYKGSDQWHVGPMAQDVEKRNPEAVERGVGGLRYIDLKAATDDSVRSRAEGGGVGGTPWAGAQGWIPTMAIHGGSGAPQGRAPSLPTQPAFDPQKFASGLGGASRGIGRMDWGGARDAGLGNLSGDAWGGGSFLGGDAYGGSSSAPLAGLDPLDYGEGFAAGGGVAGYAVGGMPEYGDQSDPGWDRPDVGPGLQTFNDRFAGEPRRMENPRTPVAEMGEGIEPGNFAGVAGVANPGDPVRMLGSSFGPQGPPTMAADDEGDDNPPAPPERTGVAGRPPVMAFSGRDDYAALPDAIRGSSDERAGLGLLPISRNAGTGLLAAGLGMLSSRSPNFGNAVGEGGLAGVSAYGAANESDRKVALEAAKLSREANKTGYDRWMGERKQGETERHNRAAEAKEFRPTWGDVDEDPITGRKIKGWIDPNKKTTTIPGATPGAAPLAATKSAGIPPHLRGAEYMAELEKQNPEFARTVKAVGDYRASITSLSQRGGLREKILEAANRYNPEYDQTHYAEKTRAISAFAAGPEGRAVRSLNVSIDHLDTLREAGDALKNGDIPLLNKIVNYAREKTGSPLTTNFDSIKQVVSAEIAKAVVGGQTALHDREDMARRAANSQSPDQLNGIITQFQKLMAGQMKGLRRAYEATTRLKNFDDFLEPRTKKALSGLSHADEVVGGGGGFTPPAGALPGKPDKNGKVWYYDPTTKQPYPGQ